MRLRQFFTTLFFPLMLAALVGCKRELPQDPGVNNAALWEISFAGTKSYLFGGIHVGISDMYPLPKVVEEAFAASKTFVIEAHPEGMTDLHAYLFMEANGRYEDRGLCAHISKETAELLRAYCEESKTPLSKMDRFKPWAASLIVDMNATKKTGYDVEKGIDKHFTKKAIANKKKIVEMETIRSHMDFFARLDPKTQELLLLYSLQREKDFKASLEAIVAVWKSGDLEAMNRMFIVEPRLDTNMELFNAKFNDDRNVEMAAKIENQIRSGNAPFVLVGAAHIPGEKGILHLLELRGFSVKQVSPARAGN